MVVGRQGYAPCKILSLQHNLFLCQLNFIEIIRLSQSCGESGHPNLWGKLPDLKQWYLSIYCKKLIKAIMKIYIYDIGLNNVDDVLIFCYYIIYCSYILTNLYRPN